MALSMALQRGRANDKSEADLVICAAGFIAYCAKNADANKLEIREKNDDQ
jgi:hypothetical protein